MAGTSGLFTFSIIFLIMEFLFIFSFQNDTTGENFITTSKLINVQAPPSPNYDTPWYQGGAVADVGKGLWYIASYIGYVVDEMFNLFSFPFMLAGKVINFSSQYPILLLANSTVIVILAYSLISRIMGGD